MMTKAYDSLLQAFKEAEAYLKGEDTGAIVHSIEVPTPDVRAIRARTGATSRARRWMR